MGPGPRRDDADRGVTPCFNFLLRISCFECQTATAMHSRAKLRELRFGVRPFERMRGAVRRTAHRWSCRRPLLAKTDGASPCGAPLAAIFQVRGPCFRVGRRSRSLRFVRRISPPQSRPRPANAWRPLVVAADGNPRPPGRARKRPPRARRRRIRLRLKTPLESAPREPNAEHDTRTFQCGDKLLVSVDGIRHFRVGLRAKRISVPMVRSIARQCVSNHEAMARRLPIRDARKCALLRMRHRRRGEDAVPQDEANAGMRRCRLSNP
jgi:hypothetical protein